MHDVVLLVEHVARELDLACAIKAQAKDHFGINVHVDSYVFDLEQTLEKHPAKIYAVPFFYSDTDRGCRHVLKAAQGRHVVNFAFEQLLSKANQNFKRPKGKLAENHVTHLSSGSEYQQLLNSFKVHPDCIQPVGSLSCGLYRHPYRTYFSGDKLKLAETFGLNPDKPWVFFPENFSAKFFTENEIRFRIRRGYRSQELRELRSWATKTFNEIAKWCAAAADLESAEIIIRPRPATDLNEFRDAFQKTTGTSTRESLHFIKQGSIREWILAADVVVSNYSTSLVESALADRPSFMLAPQAVPKGAESDWHRFAPKITSQDEFLDLVSFHSQPQPPTELCHWGMQSLLGYGDPISNVTQLFDDILSGHHTAPKIPERLPFSVLYTHWSRHYRREIENWLHLFRKRSSSSHTRHQHDQIDQAEVEHRVNRWIEIFQQQALTEELSMSSMSMSHVFDML